MSTTQYLTQDEVGILLAAASHAPSMHNSRPWRFEIHGPVIDVLRDSERAFPAADPGGRMSRIGLGAAAFNLRVAAALLGHQTTLALEPDPARPAVALRIFLGGRRAPVPGLSALYCEITRRPTDRGPLRAVPIPPELRHELTAAARAERADLDWLDDERRPQLARLLHLADERELHDQDRLHERQQWIARRDGVPEAVLPDAGGGALVRDLFDVPDRGHASFEARASIAVLTTPVEDSHAWLRAGLALQRMLLTATSHELVASFLNQALEYPDLRVRLRTALGRHAWPQLIIRCGYPAYTH
ncbi:Acg family FMN-binding oxidoreductase [Kribbella sp. WER1]